MCVALFCRVGREVVHVLLGGVQVVLAIVPLHHLAPVSGWRLIILILEVLGKLS